MTTKSTDLFALNLFAKPYLSIFRITVFLLCLSCFIISCSDGEGEGAVGETDLCLVEVDGEFIETELDEAPEYLDGGNDGFAEAIGQEIKYPAEAREMGIEGLCLIQYEITKLGTVDNVTAIQDPGGGIGSSAVSTIETVMDGVVFSPGKLDGEPVRVRKELQIRYKLEG